MKMGDSDGYLYYTSYGQIRSNNPHRFFGGNPYTEQNIILWINKNKRPFSLVLGQNLIHSGQKIKFKCHNCPSEEIPFEAPWGNIIGGSGCSICHGKMVGKYNNLKWRFPKICEEWDYEKNGFSPSDISYGSSKKVWWVCNKCGESFSMCISDRTGSNPETTGCKTCFRERWMASKRRKVRNSGRDITITNPEIVNDWDYSKNKFSPNSYTAGANEVVYWLCSRCEKGWMAPVSRRTGHYKSGCPYCSSSKGERRISNFLDLNLISYIKEKTFKDCKWQENGFLRFDFFIPSLNLIIEYDGIHHYESVRFGGMSKRESDRNFKLQKYKDKIKNEYCKKEKIRILRIPYWKFEDVEEIIKNHLDNIIFTI